MPQRTSRFAGLVTQRPALRTHTVTRRRPPPKPIAVLAPVAGIGDRVRTVADLAIAGAFSLVALPVMAVCVLLVRLTSRGPAIYSQTRVGKGGRIFTLYKIRSMYHDCERLSGPKWSTPGDPRITPLGHVFRKLHLDELPQLWNVLRGDMSLIGPRPERPEIVAKLRDVVPGYNRRHTVKPGITGFAQIHLPPDTCLQSVKNKLAYDLFYIRNTSPNLWLFILFATGMKLFGMKKLYQRKPHTPTE
ncbi:MAG: sugar transferase [Planctomycetes bacterium]|nr:sugar transferase [Planctomycetota bacterium]